MCNSIKPRTFTVKFTVFIFLFFFNNNFESLSRAFKVKSF